MRAASRMRIGRSPIHSLSIGTSWIAKELPTTATVDLGSSASCRTAPPWLGPSSAASWQRCSGRRCRRSRRRRSCVRPARRTGVGSPGRSSRPRRSTAVLPSQAPQTPGRLVPVQVVDVAQAQVGHPARQAHARRRPARTRCVVPSVLCRCGSGPRPYFLVHHASASVATRIAAVSPRPSSPCRIHGRAPRWAASATGRSSRSGRRPTARPIS